MNEHYRVTVGALYLIVAIALTFLLGILLGAGLVR